ncbi:MAG: DinB family protein [Dehalococcoidia bacterium]|nr:DinB family protein [Dehalococcoidia bacterium]MDZ4277557.1 DinB family protein [Dehalococcoidia bacterium]
MTGEVVLYSSELKRLLARLRSSVEGLDETQLNWRPPAPDANSIYVIAAHIMGNLEAWVLGIACGQPIERDRPAEFAAGGPDAHPILARAQELERRFEEALSALSSDGLGETREPPKSLWGVGSPEPVSVREALMHTIEHAAMHLGQIEITRDMALAGKA